MENHTAKHFVLQLGSLASMYLSLSFLLVLIFGVVNLAFPDAAEGIWAIEEANSQIRMGIAMTIVFLPTYLILTRLVNKTRRQKHTSNYLGLTKWLIYLSLLIGGAALLIDLVVVINTFLEGEITQRFVLKALAVLLVIGAAFYYYLMDARGYWLSNEKRSIMFGAVAGIISLVFVVFGFASIDAPAEVREKRLDMTQTSDLQIIQGQIQNYLVMNEALPATLDNLTSEIMPIAPEGRMAYRYELTEKGFRLCATFAAASEKGEYMYGTTAYAPEIKTAVILNPDNWEHGEGEWCFERVVK